jgi:hypothetical protein
MLGFFLQKRQAACLQGRLHTSKRHRLHAAYTPKAAQTKYPVFARYFMTFELQHHAR